MAEEVVTTEAPVAAEAAETEPVETGAAPEQEAPQTEAKSAPEEASEGLWEDESKESEEQTKEEDAKPGYDFSELQTPNEGLEIDQPTAEAFAAIAKEVGLDQKGFATVFNKLMPYLNQRQEEHLSEVKREFIAQAKADPDMGGSKEKWDQSLGLARKAFKRFTDAPTREILHACGLDCHPGVLKMFWNIQRAISDDVVVSGQPAASAADRSKAFFPNTKY